MTALSALSREISELVARAAPSVVGVEHRRGQGSGVVLAQDGYVLTNSHVARSGGPLQVRLSGSSAIRGELVGADDRTDLAVVRADGSGLPALTLAGERRLSVGELVFAIGNPLGFERSVSLGVVSALYRNLPTSKGDLLEGLIQTDAAVNPGNSGGPLLDAEGRVAGITTAMLPYASGIGFAVPAHTATWVAAVLMQRGEVRRPFLGVMARGEELVGAEAQETGTVRAVRILEVQAGTPAERAGLEAEDLLLSANGSPILTLDDLQRVMVLASLPEIDLEIQRSHARQRLSIRPRPLASAA